MPASVTARCSRCGHEPTHLAKPYAVWRLAVRRGPAWQGLIVVVYNLVVAVLVPRRPVCSWCYARRTQRAQHSYSFDPFVHFVRHSRDSMVLRRRAAALRPHPSTGRWDPADRAEVLAYLASRDAGRCGLCALPLPVAEGQVEHVVPKKFGLFDFSGGSARAGRTLESMLHHVDNLQVAHDYCNRAKGNSPSGFKWRHPALPPLPAARQIGTPRTYLWVPERGRDHGVPAAPTAVGTSASPSPVAVSKGPGSGARRGIRVSRSARTPKLIGAAGMVAAGLVLLFVLMSTLGRDGDDPGSVPVVAPPTPVLPTSPVPQDDPSPSAAPAATANPSPPASATAAPAPVSAAPAVAPSPAVSAAVAPAHAAEPGPTDSSLRELDGAPIPSPAQPPGGPTEPIPAAAPAATSTEAAGPSEVGSSRFPHRMIGRRKWAETRPASGSPTVTTSNGWLGSRTA